MDDKKSNQTSYWSNKQRKNINKRKKLIHKDKTKKYICNEREKEYAINQWHIQDCKIGGKLKLQGKEKCYNKIYCCFNEDGKDTIEILKEAFIDYLKNTENKAKTLEKNMKEN